MAYGQGPMQLGLVGGQGAGLTEQQARANQMAQQMTMKQEAAKRAQYQNIMQQRMQQQAQQQQAAQAAQQQQLQQTQPVRDNPAMQQMVDVANQQEAAGRARQAQGQQQEVLAAAGRGPGIPAPVDPEPQPGFMQQSFSQRLQNPAIQALLMGGLGTVEAGSRGEGPGQALIRGGGPMALAGYNAAQGAQEQDAKDAEQARRDDEMYRLQRAALERRIALGMPNSRGRMQAGVGYS